jgi:hypothetical protein
MNKAYVQMHLSCFSPLNIDLHLHKKWCEQKTLPCKPHEYRLAGQRESDA